MSENTRNLLIEYCKKYPELQLQDLFKFIYQSAFGCEHLVSSLDNVVKNIKSEYEIVKPNNDPVIEVLDGNYCRVPLSFINKGVSAEKIGELFFLSAKNEPDGFNNLVSILEIVKDLIDDQLLPFDKQNFETALSNWQENNYQPLHHSDIFKKKYSPSYRVVAKEFVPILFQLIK